MQNIQNMNYGKFIYNKINICYYYLSVFRCVLKLFETVGFFKMNLGVVGVFCTISCYFEYDYRILCIFLYIGTYLKDMF